MQLILLHPRFSARTITLTHWHLAMAGILLLGTILLTAGIAYYLTLRHAPQFDLPLVRDLLPGDARDHGAHQEKYVRENLAAMAVKVGEMQARLMRLDALGERVQGLAGVRPEEFNFREVPGRGGVALSRMPEPQLSMEEFQVLLDELARGVEYRTDYLNVVESTLMSQKIKAKMLPTVQPVDIGYNASGFGSRLDPFSGRSSFHAGIDFAAAAGTPIVAAAGGVVIAAEYHHQFGNMVEIDHGNDIVTRYAHASKLNVKLGDIVRRGQHIANIGSTGRSTGAHLHFEVLVKGVQQDPHKFLSAGADQAKLDALAAR